MMDKEDLQYNLMFLEEGPRLDDRLGTVFRAAMRELQRLGYAETYTTGGGKTAWRLTDQGRQAAKRIPAQRRADFEEAKHIAAESGGLAGEWWLSALTSGCTRWPPCHGADPAQPGPAPPGPFNRRLRSGASRLRFRQRRLLLLPPPRPTGPPPKPTGVRLA